MKPTFVPRISFVATCIAGSLLLPQPVAARLSGELEVSYQEYSEKTDTGKSSKSSFLHQYSLLYDKRGTLGKGGQFGAYNFGLGYEWASLDFSAKQGGVDVGSKVSRGHLLYNLEYRYKSKALPLNLYVYSQDSNRQNMSIPLSYSTGNIGDSVVPNAVTETIQVGGTKMTSGATLAFGEIMSDPLTSKFPRLVEIPRILIDYREEYVSNLQSTTPQNSRTRWMNSEIGKDSVWLTYKVMEMKDYLTKNDTLGALVSRRSGSDERSIRIGTVNQQDERLWVDLTNWIRVSSDGAMTKVNAQDSRTNSFSEYDFNFFATAVRERWQAKSFNTFSRRIDGNLAKEEKLNIPLYINGTWNTDTTWQVRFEHRDERNSNFPESWMNTSSSATARVETLKRSPFTLTPSVSVEIADLEGTRKFALRGGVQTASTRRFSDRFDVYGSYEITKITEESDAKKTDQFTNNLSGKVNYRLAKNLVVSAEERLTLSSGSTTSTQGAIVNNAVSTNTGATFLDTRTETTASEYMRSVTSAKVEWSPSARLKLNSQASLDMYDVKGNDLDMIMTFSGGIDYSLPKGSVGAVSRYIQRTAQNEKSNEISLSGFGQYAPAQNVNSSVKGTFTQADQYGEIKKSSDLLQQINYVIPGRSNRGRIELQQQSQYIQGSDTAIYGNLYKGVRQFSLQGKYFFTGNLYASAISRYSLLSPGNVNEWMGGASLGMDYKLLQGSLEYYQGKRSGTNDNRAEKRFSANLKKQF